MQRVCIIGIGNEYRSDDGAGLLVARNVRNHQSPDVRVRECSGEGAGLMEAWQGSDSVFLVDAVRSGAPAGTTFLFDASQQAIPSQLFHYSTHSFSLAEAVELARILGRLPTMCFIYGIEGKNFGEGRSVTPDVMTAVEKVTAAILQDIKSVSLGVPREEEKS